MTNAKYGIECSYQERLTADPHAFHVVFYTSVMEIIQQHKEKIPNWSRKPAATPALKQRKWLSVQIDCTPQILRKLIFVICSLVYGRSTLLLIILNPQVHFCNRQYSWLPLLAITSDKTTNSMGWMYVAYLSFTICKTIDASARNKYISADFY